MKARLGWMAAVGAVGLLLAACLPVSGGGYISGVNGGKANFGFSVACDSSSHLTGAWNYNDKGAGVNIAGDMSSVNQGCPDGSPGRQSYASTYTAQGKCRANCTGFARIDIFDGGGRGSLKGDCLDVILFNGVFDGYSNFDPSGTECSGDPLGGLKPVLGGNLTVG